MSSETYILLAFVLVIFGVVKYKKLFISFLDNKIQEINKIFYQSESEKNNCKVYFKEIEHNLLKLEQKKEEQILHLIQKLDMEFKFQSEKIDKDFANQKTRIEEASEVNYIKIKNYSYIELIKKSFISANNSLLTKDPELIRSHIFKILYASKTNLK